MDYLAYAIARRLRRKPMATVIPVAPIAPVEKPLHITGKLVHDTRSGQFFIAVTYPDGNCLNLWESIIAHCARALTDNELKQVWEDCNTQMDGVNQRDIPKIFTEILHDLTRVIMDRGLSL